MKISQITLSRGLFIFKQNLHHNKGGTTLKGFATAVCCPKITTHPKLVPTIQEMCGVEFVDLITEPEAYIALSVNNFLAVEEIRRRTAISNRAHQTEVLIIARHPQCTDDKCHEYLITATSITERIKLLGNFKHTISLVLEGDCQSVMDHSVPAIGCIDGRTHYPVEQLLGIGGIKFITEPGADKALSSGNPNTINSILRKVFHVCGKNYSGILPIIGHDDCAANPEPQEIHLSQLLEAKTNLDGKGIFSEVIPIWVHRDRGQWEAQIVK